MNLYTKKTICYAEEPLPLMLTLYSPENAAPRGLLLYVHGGGLLYGEREDLPDHLVDTLTAAGYLIAACDYRLAPQAKVDDAVSDVVMASTFVQNYCQDYYGQALPFFLWGRSAGAYLTLLTSMELPTAPRGILSFYGYGLFTPYWYDEPSAFYNELPPVDEAVAQKIVGDSPRTNVTPLSGFALYIYARQRGRWHKMTHDADNPRPLFDALASSNRENRPPLFLCHAQDDPDVPYGESLALQARFSDSVLFTAPVNEHDFDREANSLYWPQLRATLLAFLNHLTA